MSFYVDEVLSEIAFEKYLERLAKAKEMERARKAAMDSKGTVKSNS